MDHSLLCVTKLDRNSILSASYTLYIVALLQWKIHSQHLQQGADRRRYIKIRQHRRSQKQQRLSHCRKEWHLPAEQRMISPQPNNHQPLTRMQMSSHLRVWLWLPETALAYNARLLLRQYSSGSTVVWTVTTRWPFTTASKWTTLFHLLHAWVSATAVTACAHSEYVLRFFMMLGFLLVSIETSKNSGRSQYSVSTVLVDVFIAICCRRYSLPAFCSSPGKDRGWAGLILHWCWVPDLMLIYEFYGLTIILITTKKWHAGSIGNISILVFPWT